MDKPTTLFVGLDVHKDSISVAYAIGETPEPPVFVGPICNRHMGARSASPPLLADRAVVAGDRSPSRVPSSE